MTAEAAQQALGQLVNEFHVEASLWPDLRAALIRQQADVLDDIRVRTIRGHIVTETAFAWLDAGRLSLAELRYKRTLVGNSAIDHLMKSRLR
jgi:hypothetical protein